MILNNKIPAEDMTIPDTKLDYRATALKTAWYWHKNTNAGQWNHIEDTDINLHIYIFDKETRNTHWTKDSMLNKWCL